MQTLPDYHLDALFRTVMEEEAEALASSAASESQMLERVGRVLARRRTRRQLATLLLAAVLTTLTAAAIALGGSRVTPPVTPARSAEASTAPEPSLLPSPSPRGEVVHPWPDTTENQAGLYAWGRRSCGPSCNLGFMHNGYGSGDVDITINVVPESAIPDDGTSAVTVAGHDGIYTRIDDRHEEWIVDIEGTTIAIRLTTEPGTSDADMAEAHAIIDSMYTEADELARYGFRLVFRLTTNDWDSG